MAQNDQKSEFGTLRIVLRFASGGQPAAGATVKIGSGKDVVSTVLSGAGGEATALLPAPPYALSQTPSPPKLPYSVYDVMITLTGYIPVLLKSVQVFPGVLTKQDYKMVRTTDDPKNKMYVVETPKHKLSYTVPSDKKTAAPDAAVQTSAAVPVRTVTVPQNITVHLGAPASNSPNVTVPFLYYIKNVASSEIYPTWPEAALRANIYAQITLALNRIYTEWYRAQGYDFDITSSPAYDQYFINDRAVFDSVSVIADEIFSDYVARAGSIAPVYTEYCDGYLSQCAGMSQWGTVELANKYYTPLDILRAYYGDNVYIKQAVVQETAPPSFPGTLKTGDESPDVALVQSRLNRIAINYPKIPFIPYADGTYTQSTETSVKAFQRVFGLAQTGTVNEETWYRIIFIYNAVKKLAELGSEGESISNDGYPGSVITIGDRGLDVLRIEYYLARISAYLGSGVVPPPNINGVFDTDGRPAVTGFQRFYGLPVTGYIDEATWNAIVKTFYDIPGDLTPSPVEYPGYPLRQGSAGQDVRFVQEALNTVGKSVPEIPALDVDGVFGALTKNAVKAFQSYFGLQADGVVGPLTWAKLNEEYSGIQGDVG